jgi:hypothetical protein
MYCIFFKIQFREIAKLFSLVLAFTVTSALAQIVQHRYGNLDHIVTIDSAFQTGRVQILNDYQINFIKNTDTTLYTASQLNEFSFYGRLYKSISVNGKSIFGKVLSAGNLSLYQSKHALFLKSGSQIKPLERANFRESLKPYTNYKGLTSMNFKHRSIKHLVDHTNNAYSLKYVPEWRWGVLIGPQFYRLGVKIQALDSKRYSTTGSSLIGGLYYDIPFYRFERVSFSGELLYIQSREKEFEIPMDRVQLRNIVAPVSLKWFTHFRPGLRTYIKSGLVPGLNFTRLSALKTQSTSVEVGFLGSFGVEFESKSSPLVNFELRYLNPGKIGKDYYSVKYSSLSILAGIGF